MACISDSAGLIYYETNQGGTTKEVFVNFLYNLDVILGDFNPLIIMDNALCHNSLAEVFPNRDFVYLPPYSPFLNPIESCFSALKARLKQLLKDVVDIYNHQYARRQGITLQELRRRLLQTNLNIAVLVVTPDLCTACYNRADTFLLKFVHNEDIWH